MISAGGYVQCPNGHRDVIGFERTDRRGRLIAVDWRCLTCKAQTTATNGRELPDECPCGAPIVWQNDSNPPVLHCERGHSWKAGRYWTPPEPTPPPAETPAGLILPYGGSDGA